MNRRSFLATLPFLPRIAQSAVAVAAALRARIPNRLLYARVVLPPGPYEPGAFTGALSAELRRLTDDIARREEHALGLTVDRA